MAAEKLSISLDAELASMVRKAAGEEMLSVSEWLADAAAAKVRHRYLEEALESFAAQHGALSEAEVDTIVRDARRTSVVTGRRATKSRPKRRRKAA